MNDTPRSRAEEKFAKAQERDKLVAKERAKSETALNDKILRLRALRHAKEAADREELERKAAEKAAAKAAMPPRRRKAPAKS